MTQELFWAMAVAAGAYGGFCIAARLDRIIGDLRAELAAAKLARFADAEEFAERLGNQRSRLQMVQRANQELQLDRAHARLIGRGCGEGDI